jgi:lysophospholipase L1-like esterase
MVFRTGIFSGIATILSVAAFSLVAFSLAGPSVSLAQGDSEPRRIEVAFPVRHQVFQRRYEVPQLAHNHHPGGPAKGYAQVAMGLRIPSESRQKVLFRVRNDQQQQQQQQQQSAWKQAAEIDRTDGQQPPEGITQIVIPVPAGGWYRVDLRVELDGQSVGHATSEPFGVGEVFLIAGQSYATNCNDERLQVTDPAERVVAHDLKTQTWKVAHDPQPTLDSSDGGSIWPPFGDLLAQCYDVPIGLVNVAVGATSTSQWKTDGELFQHLIQAGTELKDFRAVLWQQGESDVIEKTTTATYVERLIEFRAQADRVWGSPRPWMLAKSTLHPTVYNEPVGEAKIRQAIETLIAAHGFMQGPDTDRLDGANRGPMQSRRHFTGLGQRNAAAMWFAAVTKQLDAPKPLYTAQVPKLSDLHLRSPAWKSPIVYRESSVLLQDDQGANTARLAFPATEVLQVRTALGFETFQEGTHWRLDQTRSVLEWIGQPPVKTIAIDQLFVPAGSPNSYKHRTGNPDEYLLYAPGKWFHERNIEITYRRADSIASPTEKSSKSFEKTLRKLKAKSNVVIAVSGDSISTGLDASATTQTEPNQPGYPDLLAAQLTHDFDCPIDLVNRSVAGWSIANGLADLEKLLESKPDLLIVAYGMNDVGRRDPVWFAAEARKLQARAKELLPDLEILWVAPMLGNREWIHTPREMFFGYRDALRGVVQEGQALADLTEVWEILLQRKHDLDLTGNGLNHPNDFGHRLYAQAILEFLNK